ncbi:tetratricopeptide repeat protein [Aridibaculum aurantiacum]|uniref:tetratricopeptide repeat protein n=1 Tax=Aridibaculum aurantiacum TaxID=2810307 RepID=UPI001A977199|nr:tetratricopeptide repeat protein [Aridibaculum aurantiacum]
MKTTTLLLVTACFLLSTTFTAFGQKKSQTITFSSSNPEAMELFNQGLKAYDELDFPTANRLFKQAAAKDQNFAAAFLFASSSSQNPKEFAENIAKAKSIKNATAADKLQLQLAESFLTDNWNQRMAAAQAMVKTFPQSARAYVELANTYAANYKMAEARKAFEKAIQLEPDWVGGYVGLASSYAFDEPKNMALAEKYASQAVERTPNSVGMQVLLGDVYRGQHALEKARDAYSNAMKIQEDNPVSYYKRGHALTYLGKLEDARKDYMMAGQKDKEGSSLANQSIAFTYLYADDPTTAYKFLVDAESEITPSTNPVNNQRKYELLYAAANIASHTNNPEQVIDIMKKMEPLSMQIGNDLGTKEGKHLTKSDMLYWRAIAEAIKGDFNAAEKTANEMKTELASIVNPRKYETHESLLGFINFKQARYDQAVNNFKQSNKNNVYNKYWLARSYEAAGDKANATAIYKEIADHNFNSVGYALIRNEVKNKIKE